MPRFSAHVLGSLKKVMLLRAPACFFTPQDIAALVEETELEESVIVHWAENLRWKAKNGMVPDLHSFLKVSDADQKVT